MSEEAKVVEPEGEPEKAPLSLDEQRALVDEKVKELRAAGVKVPDLQMMHSPAGLQGPPPSFGGPMMTAMPGIPQMAAGPQHPLPHRMDPRAMQPHDMPAQQNHPMIRREKPRKADISMTEEGLIQLDPILMLEIELLTAEIRAADAEERLAVRSLRDARDKVMALQRKQALMMSTITQQLGIEPGKSIRLVDKEQRLCRIEE